MKREVGHRPHFAAIPALRSEHLRARHEPDVLTDRIQAAVHAALGLGTVHSLEDRAHQQRQAAQHAHRQQRDGRRLPGRGCWNLLATIMPMPRRARRASPPAGRAPGRCLTLRRGGTHRVVSAVGSMFSGGEKYISKNDPDVKSSSAQPFPRFSRTAFFMPMSIPPFVLVLAGGSGERFWPLSRRAKPKQLLKLLSDQTLLEETLAGSMASFRRSAS